MSGNSNKDRLSIKISLNKMEKVKSYKKTNLQKISMHVCALLNSNNGGTLEINIDETDDCSLLDGSGDCVTINRDATDQANDLPNSSCDIDETDIESCEPDENVMHKYHKIIEQQISSMVGIEAISLASVKRTAAHTFMLHIEKSRTFKCCAYNLCLPTQTQVNVVLPDQPIQTVVRVVSTKEKDKDAQTTERSTTETFVKGQKCNLRESATVQLKNVKSKATKNVSIVQRIVVSNKLVNYISGFGNMNGGHIYFGITDDRMVAGLTISGNDQMKLEREVEKTVNGMAWSDESNQPKRGQHWEIFFDPVHDSDNNVIPSTYVIVIYVAAYQGLVFTKEPESYVIVDGKVKRISFAEWKTKLSLPEDSQSKVLAIPEKVTRCTWSSRKREQTFKTVSGDLQRLVDNGMWKDFKILAKTIQQSNAETEITCKLAVLSKEIIENCRRSRFAKARAGLKRFSDIHQKSKDVSIFETICLYLKAAYHRYNAQLPQSETAFQDAEQKARMIQPGTIIAAVHAFGATLCSTKPESGDFSLENSRDLLLKALDHLCSMDKTLKRTSDLKAKIHIYLALTYLGCSLTRMEFRENIPRASLDEANRQLKAVQDISLQCPLSRFRETQFKLALSVQYYRRSQIEHCDDTDLIESAFNEARAAQNRAKKCQFDELFQCAQTCKDVYTEGLVRYHFEEKRRRPQA